MKTVFLDVEGLVRYPTFRDRLYRPLKRKKDMGVGFWTGASPQTAYDILRESGIISRPSFLITAKEYLLLTGFIQRGCVNRELYERLWSDSGITEEELQTRGARWGELIEEFMFRFKYPPYFAEQGLLVESDMTNAYDSKEGPEIPIQVQDRVELYNRFAEKAGFSLIMVPEYPEVWSYPGVRETVKPEKIIEEIRGFINSWKGERFTIDLGVEMGIYRPFGTPEKK